MQRQATIDPRQAELFGGIAADWWNPKGESALLHRINPARLGYIRHRIDAHFGCDPRARHPLAGRSALDVGCGAGLLCEPLARLGADVTGLDAATQTIEVARAHASAQGLVIDYRQGELAQLADGGRRFDLVTCMEVIEHVTALDDFLATLAGLLAPGGLLIFSTPNRTNLSYAVLIAGAENILKLIPKGAHDWNSFVTPEELTAAMAKAGLVVSDVRGLSLSPSRGFVVSDDKRVNYIGSAVAA